EEYEFHTVFHAVLDFLTVDLSAFYLDVTKDRVYCSAPDSPLRRSAQTAMFHILRDSLLLMAPILSFTTDEAWGFLPAHSGREESVHLGVFRLQDRSWLGGQTDLMEEMEKLLEVRERVLKELEKARETKAIGNSLEALVVVRASGPTHDLLVKSRGLLAELFIVSAVELEAAAGGDVEARVERAPGAKCERCWNYSTSVGRSAAHPTFCARCADVVQGSRG
ncbi:MAG: class I tRNA ligase family protein, partial [Candidatus Aminicenantes bacterium]|nr:class I tRNA ligase family protein [Candidatus Aminicenantes bacterium]